MSPYRDMPSISRTFHVSVPYYGGVDALLVFECGPYVTHVSDNLGHVYLRTPDLWYARVEAPSELAVTICSTRELESWRYETRDWNGLAPKIGEPERRMGSDER